MDGTKPAAPSGQPEVEPEVVVPLSLAVVMGKAADASRICRVDAPDRVLRIWAMLSSVNGELHQASLRPEARARLQRQLGAFTAELKRSLSPALAGELHRIIDRDEDTELTADELRVEYATLLAWTIGLVIGILSQIDAASTKIGRPGSHPQMVTSE
jgi:Bacterial proteasome activator